MITLIQAIANGFNKKKSEKCRTRIFGRVFSSPFPIQFIDGKSTTALRKDKKLSLTLPSKLTFVSTFPAEILFDRVIPCS